MLVGYGTRTYLHSACVPRKQPKSYWLESPTRAVSDILSTKTVLLAIPHDCMLSAAVQHGRGEELTYQEENRDRKDVHVNMEFQGEAFPPHHDSRRGADGPVRVREIGMHTIFNPSKKEAAGAYVHLRVKNREMRLS